MADKNADSAQKDGSDKMSSEMSQAQKSLGNMSENMAEEDHRERSTEILAQREHSSGRLSENNNNDNSEKPHKERSPFNRQFKSRINQMNKFFAHAEASAAVVNTLDQNTALAAHETALLRQYHRRCDAYIMSMVFTAWCLFYLDRGTISLAYINGMGQDLKLDGKQLNVAVMIFFAAYILVNIPANLLLRKIGARYWLSGLIFTWGMCTTTSGFVKEYRGLIIARVFLGLCEGGFLGGALLYLGFFYTRRELMMRIGIFFCSTPLAAAVAGLLALGLGGINHSGYRGWPWIFFVEGAVTCVAGVLAFFLLPDTPEKAGFLTPDQKKLARDRLKHDNGQRAAEDGHVEPIRDRLRSQTAKLALTHPLTPLMALSAFLTVSVVYSWNLFMPPIMSAFVQPDPQIPLTEKQRLYANGLTIPPNVVGCLSTIFLVRAAQGLPTVGVSGAIIFSSVVGMSGYSLLLGGGTMGRIGAQYSGVFLVATAIYPLMPLGLYWITVNAKPHFERAIAIGFVVMIGNFGAFVASFTYIPTEYP